MMTLNKGDKVTLSPATWVALIGAVLAFVALIASFSSTMLNNQAETLKNQAETKERLIRLEIGQQAAVKVTDRIDRNTDSIVDNRNRIIILERRVDGSDNRLDKLENAK